MGPSTGASVTRVSIFSNSQMRAIFLLIAVAMGSLIVSGTFYSGGSEYVQEKATAKIELSARAQGPALFATRDEGAKLITRFVFLLLFVFFVRTNRDPELRKKALFWLGQSGDPRALDLIEELLARR